MSFNRSPIKPLRFLIQALSAFVVALNAAQIEHPADAAQTSEKVLLLKQTSSFQGVVKTYVSKNAVKICFTNFHGHLIARAPSWKVAIVNDDDKTCFEADYAYWMKHNIARTYLPDVFTEPGKLMQCLGTTSAKYANQNCRESIYNASPCKAKFFGMNRKDITDEKACLIMEKWFATPFADCIPLGFKYFNSQGIYLSDLPKKDRIMLVANYVDPLQCASVETVDCPNSFFAYPVNYKKVNSEKAATDSSRNKDMLNELFDSGIVK